MDQIADSQLQTVIQLNNELDPDDPDDIALQTRVLEKMKREQKKDFDELISEQVWNIHDEKGNLVPHVYRDGKFQKYDPPKQDEENSQ